MEKRRKIVKKEGRNGKRNKMKREERWLRKREEMEKQIKRNEKKDG